MIFVSYLWKNGKLNDGEGETINKRCSGLSHLTCAIIIFTLKYAEHGFVGYSEELMLNNTLPDYSPGETFFTVFGVFFPADTGLSLIHI